MTHDPITFCANDPPYPAWVSDEAPIYLSECHEDGCDWYGWFFDHEDARRHAAAHVARGEGR